MPQLRGHHLICLHFFHGKGYDKKFIRNLNKILTSAALEGVSISSGADDVCHVCPWLKDGRCEHGDNTDTAIREMDTKALELLDLSTGTTKGWDVIRDRVRGIFRDWYNRYCMECDWNGICEQDDFFAQLEARL